jgi:predicted dehydrogenase
MPRHSFRRRVSRRSFLHASAATAAAASFPAGAFAGGHDRVRVGLVGCGGRGTAAALHAVAAAPGVEVVAVGDRFADQAARAAATLAAEGGRTSAAILTFAGHDAADRVIAADVDVVILATPPHLRPAHAVAAIRAGRHVFCETPAAVDAAGVRSLLAAGGEALSRGLSFVSGFESRHHAGLAAAVTRVVEGSIGRPTHAVAVSELGLPWRRTRLPGWTDEEHEARNWIESARLSGGPLVEHQVHAIDRVLWTFGDEAPVSATPVPSLAALPAPAHPSGGMKVLYRFRDGRTLLAGIERREGIVTRIDEAVHGTGGSIDLREARFATPTPQPTPQLTCMAALIGGLRAGRRIDDLEAACRSTMAAVMGRDAATTGSEVEWAAVWPVLPDRPSPQPLQSARV